LPRASALLASYEKGPGGRAEESFGPEDETGPATKKTERANQK
jgi:hypothetical protein